MKNKLRILITGATGFVGRHLINLLSSDVSKFEIYGSCFPEKPERSADLGIKEIFYLDLRSEESVQEAVKEFRPAWIFHLAAISNVRISWEMRRETLETNLMGTFFLYEAVLNFVPGARILFVSSSDVYGYLKPAQSAYKEEDRSGVVSPYAFTKVSGELLCEFYTRVENLDIVIARPFPHTGPGQSPDFVCSDWARQIALIEKSWPFPKKDPVIKVGNLETKRDYSDVRDVVRAYYLLMQKGRKGEVYNVCSGRTVALKNILKILLSFSQSRAKIQTDAAKIRKGDIPYLAGDNQKIIKETGWKPQIPLEKSLKDLLEYWRQRV